MDQHQLAVRRTVGIKGIFFLAVLVSRANFVTDFELLLRIQNAAVPGFGMLAIILQALLEIVDDGLSIGLFCCETANDPAH